MSKVDLNYNETQYALRGLYRRFLVMRIGAVLASSFIVITIGYIASKEPIWDKSIIYACFIVYIAAAIYSLYQLVQIALLIIKCYFVKDLSMKRVKKTADDKLCLRGPFFKKYYLDTKI